ncbi:MFS transporter [Evansella halocellulosilytica]|uniref:MFS transporter n=1 Tax=Evansella halocellulosilytica TaxID=2011013 RepID=UPI000BB8F77A|nr:MFS transporter [Evansella halocellulosilytica]
MKVKGHRKEEILLNILVFTLIFSVMNVFLFNVVLPVIRNEFVLTSSQVSWMMSSYMIVYATGTVFYGKLADQYRLKDLLTFGLLVFAFGSLIGVTSVNYGMVIAARVLQAAGAAVIPTIAMIIPVRYFPEEKRGRALGTMAVGMAIGTALGPVLSGFVSEVVNWRYLFCIPFLTLITVPLFRKYLDDERGERGKVDLIGGDIAYVNSSFISFSAHSGKFRSPFCWSFFRNYVFKMDFLCRESICKA